MHSAARPLPTISLLVLVLVGCQALLDDHPKVDVDYCGDYKGDDECCAKDDPCGLGDNQDCECFKCDWDQGDCTMEWTFTDVWDDGQSVHVGLYEVGDNGELDDGEKQWEGLELKQHGEPYTKEIHCTEDEKICYGGWSDDGAWTWGCSENCSQYCESCCWFCNYQDHVTMQLGP